MTADQKEQGAHLAALKAQRDALNAEIGLIERGIQRAAYDACIAQQLANINDSREADGKPRLSMSVFLSGVEGDHP